MSSIEKMQIRGIRSFNPDTPEIIEFYHPLTLILGPNGTGKTTIIECLKYITCGDMPPNAKRDGGFVHDPKVHCVPELKAQVKLQFQDLHKKTCVASRSLQATQKAKKIEVKTLDSTIKRRSADGEMGTISSKCAEMDSEMISLLGVSKPILENVIFVHQEEANWPLQDASTLKTKFDAIFASTRYVKALDQIRKCSKAKTQLITNYRTELKYLEQNKVKATDVKRNLGDTEGKYVASRERVEDLEKQLQPIEKQLDRINHESEKIKQISIKIEKSKSARNEIEQQCEDLRKQIKSEFDGTTDELREALHDFEEKNTEMKEEWNKLNRKVTAAGEKVEELSDSKSKLIREQAKLEQEAQQNERNRTSRNEKIQKFAVKYKIDGFEDDISEGEAKTFDRNMKDIATDLMAKANERKTAFEAKEKKFQDKIDKKRKEKTTLETELSMKDSSYKTNKVELGNLRKELSRVEESGERLDEVQRELRGKTKELDEVEGSVDVETLKSEIEKRKGEKSRKENQMKQLDSELNRISNEAQARTQIEVYRKDKESKEVQLKRLNAKHKEILTDLLGEVPTSMYKNAVENALRKVKENLARENEELRKYRSEQTKLETERKMDQQTLNKREEELKRKRKQLNESFKGNDFDKALDDIQKEIKSAESDYGLLEASDRFYKKYLGQLRESDAPCPLCHREFSEDGGEIERDDLISELEGIIANLPASINKHEKKLKKGKEQYERMMMVKPVKEMIHDMEETEVPNLQSKLKSCEARLEKLEELITDKIELVEQLQSEEHSAQQIRTDMSLMDRNQAELKELEKKITAQSARLSGGDSSRTMKDVQKDREDLQFDLDSVNRSLDRDKEKLDNYFHQVQSLRAEKQTLESEKLQIEGDIQKKVTLETKRDELETTQDKLQEEINEAKMQMRPLQEEIDELLHQKDLVTIEKNEQTDKDRDEYNSVRESMKEIKLLQRDIDRFVDMGKPERLSESKRDMNKLEASLEKCLAEKQELSEKVQAIKDDLASQEVNHRNLKDNLMLRKRQKEIELKSRNISELEKDIEDFDVTNLNKELRELRREQEEITNERAHAKGRMAGFEDEIRRYKKELKEEMYDGADKKYKDKLYELKTTEMAKEDLQKYYTALDQTIMAFHQRKMDDINKIISELWRNTYRGNDIETIEIRAEGSDEGGKAVVNLDKKRSITYRVVMLRAGIPIDMRGRCSAGQKVLASLIIRLALAETFCLNCGILALDEPTTNLDRENIASLANALVDITKNRSKQKNFQLIVITHDEDFVELIGQHNLVGEFFKVRKDRDGYSKLARGKVEDLHQR